MILEETSLSEFVKCLEEEGQIYLEGEEIYMTASEDNGSDCKYLTDNNHGFFDAESCIRYMIEQIGTPLIWGSDEYDNWTVKLWNRKLKL